MSSLPLAVSTPSAATATKFGLTFFSPSLILDFGDAVITPDAPDLLIERALAGSLACAPGGIERPTYRQARRDDTLRWRRAQLLLAEMEFAEMRRDERARELWDEVEEEWAWVARSAVVREQLVARARELGAWDPAAATEAVMAGINSELLPGLRLKWLMLAPRKPGAQGKLGPHGAALNGWTLGSDSSPGQLQLYGWYVLTLMELAAELPKAVFTSTQALVSTRGLVDPHVETLVAHVVAHGHSRLKDHFENAKASGWWFSAGIADYGAIADAGADTAELFHLLSLLHVGYGVGQTGDASTFATGAEHIVTAVVLNPLNADAQGQLQMIRELPESLASQHRTLLREGRASPGAAHIVAGFQAGLKRALKFLESDAAAALRQRRRSAATWSIASRLGLDPREHRTRERLAAFCAVLDYVANEDGVTRESYAQRVYDAALEYDEELAQLEWQRLLPALSNGILPLGDGVVYAIPEPVPPAFADLVAPVREAAAASVVAVPAATLGDRNSAWLLGRRDRGYKAAAAAGLLLTVGSLSLRGVNEFRAARLDRGYRTAVAAVRATDDSAAVEAGLTFLIATHDSTDARVAQIAELTRDAALRRVVALAEGRRQDEAKALLNRYQRIAAQTLTSTEPIQ